MNANRIEANFYHLKLLRTMKFHHSVQRTNFYIGLGESLKHWSDILMCKASGLVFQTFTWSRRWPLLLYSQLWEASKVNQ